MKVLIVIDMQHDFIDGTLGSQEAQQIVSYVKHKIEEYREEACTIVFTRDTHTSDYLSTQEGKNLPVEHCIRHTSGWNIYDGLSKQGDLIFDKVTFGSVELAEYLAKHHMQDEFLFVGLCTDICVISNAMLLKAYLPEAQICVDAKGCAGATVSGHETALAAMKACQIQIINE